MILRLKRFEKTLGFARIQVLHKAYPNHFGSAVKVMNSNGKKKTVKIANAKGDPEWPLKDEDLLKKFYDLAESGSADSSRVQELAKALLQSPLSTPLPKILLSAP